MNLQCDNCGTDFKVDGTKPRNRAGYLCHFVEPTERHGHPTTVLWENDDGLKLCWACMYPGAREE